MICSKKILSSHNSIIGRYWYGTAAGNQIEYKLAPAAAFLSCWFEMHIVGFDPLPRPRAYSISKEVPASHTKFICNDKIHRHQQYTRINIADLCIHYIIFCRRMLNFSLNSKWVTDLAWGIRLICVLNAGAGDFRYTNVTTWDIIFGSLSRRFELVIWVLWSFTIAYGTDYFSIIMLRLISI